MPDLTCDSGYARQNTFDPERQGPICLTKEEIQQTASGGNPGATIPDKRCASGYAYASAEKATTYGSNPVCVTVDELSEFKRRTALTPNVDGSLKETRLAGRVDVKIHEFDSEGGEHVRTVGVPLDEKVEGGALNYGKKQLLKLKGEGARTAELAEEIELQQLIADARAVAWERVAGLQTAASDKLQLQFIADAREVVRGHAAGAQTTASDKVNTLLEAAELYVEKVLPAQEEGEAQAFKADADATKATRVYALSTTVSRRFKKKAMAKLEGATLQLRETTATNPIVHLDLVRYSELLDLASVRERVAARYTVAAATAQTSETYAVVRGYVVRASDKTSALSEELKANVQVRVLTPAKDFYAVATAEYIKRKESANDLYALGSESILTRREFAVKYLESVKAALGSQWDSKLYTPTMAFLDACEANWAPLRTAYNEGVENPNNTDEDGKPLTIDAGTAAFIAALRMKLQDEWDLRVVPTLEKLKGSTAEVFVDAQAH